MARPRQWPPKIHHDKRSGRDRVRIYQGDTWTWQTLGPHGSEEARRAYLQILHMTKETKEPASASPAPVQSLTVEDLVSGYLLAVRPGLDPKEDWHVLRAMKPLLQLHATTSVSDFGPVALQAVRDHILRPNDLPGERLSARYVSRILRRIVRVWEWAVGREMVHLDVLTRLQLLAPLGQADARVSRPGPILDVPRETVEATLPWLHGVVGDMVRLQMACGARPGEVCRLCPQEIDRVGLLVAGVRVWVWTPAKHKKKSAGKIRRIPLGPQAQTVLGPYLERAPATPCFSPRESLKGWREERGQSVTAGASRQPGDHYLVTSYCHAVAKAVVRGNRELNRQARATAEAQGLAYQDQVFIESWHPHRLRHAAATLVQAELGLDEARAMLGHEDLKTTAVYAHAELLRAARAAAKLG